jgi:hypothetical protein
MKRALALIIIALALPVLSFSSDNSRRVVNILIKPGVKDILLGKTRDEILKLIKEKYKSNPGSDNACVFKNHLSMESFIEKYAPAIASLRSHREWKYKDFVKLTVKFPYNNFIEAESIRVWLTSEYPLKYKRWKKYKIMLAALNPFVRRVDLAFYRDILYYAKFYIKAGYRFNDTYLPENEENFMMHLYTTYQAMYGPPIIFNNFEYHWRDKNVELSLDGKNASITFIDFNVDKFVVRYLKNVSIVLAKMQQDIITRADYVDRYLRDFE